MSRWTMTAFVLAAVAVAGGVAGAAPARVAPKTTHGTAASATSATAKKPVPAASARGWAVRVLVPGGSGGATPVASAPGPGAGTADRPSFSYPHDGSVIITGPTQASATARISPGAVAAAGSSVRDVTIFDGEITADAATAAGSARAGKHAASGAFGGTGVVNLQALGVKVGKGSIRLGKWGSLTVARTGVDRSAPHGTKGFGGSVTALDIRLTAAHGGLPAGSEIEVGVAEVAVETAPAATATAVGGTVVEPLPGDRPQLLPPATGPLIGVPQVVHPDLTAGPYVFPVYGRVSYSDGYGVTYPDVAYQHGDDISGQLGQPLLAVADGTLYSVGWNRAGGNRLWLRDRAGNEFYYAHLSAFTTLAANGARVQAGQVIGFMGNTGDNQAGSPHLRFEVHPVSLLFLGFDGAVDPTPYLASWRKVQALAFPISAGWAPSVPGTIKAPEPGAILLGSTDISSADGLDPSSLRRVGAPAAARG